jgi:hypothetical protein
MNKHTKVMAVLAAAGFLLGGCGSSGNGSGGIPPISSTNPASNGKLTFAVGTANIEGTTALNVVTTFRSSDGLSASLVNTPTITGPFTFTEATAPTPAPNAADPFSTIPGGPGAMDLAAGAITGTPQTVHVGLAPTAFTESSFGQSGGVFSQSLSPGNEQGSTGQAYSYVPYGIDAYETTALAGDPGNTPFGGPPAFDPDGDGMGLRDGLNLLGHGVLGIPEGFTAFSDVNVSAGTYTMSLSVATGFSGSTPTFQTVTGKASLTNTAPLPTLSVAALNFTPDGSGGAAFTVPASYFTDGVSEVYVQVIDTGDGSGNTNCQGTLGATGGAGPVYYTVIATAAGSYTLPDTDGPNTNTTGGTSNLTPSESICTAAANSTATSGSVTVGDTYEVIVYGTDYDMYGYSFIKAKSPPPQVASFNGGQADITVSAPGTATYPAVPAISPPHTHLPISAIHHIR